MVNSADKITSVCSLPHLLKWPFQTLNACDAGKNVDGSPSHEVF